MHAKGQLAAALLTAAVVGGWAAPARADKVCQSDETTACSEYNGQYLCPKNPQLCRSEVISLIPLQTRQVCPANSGSTTYPCINTGATHQCNPDVCVERPPPPEITITAAPATIERGQNTTLTWTTKYARNCDAGGNWSGGKALSGSQTLAPSPEGTYYYWLNCGGPSGTTSGYATVTVIKPLPMVTISASPTVINDGQQATLTWSSTNSVGCTATADWSGSRALSGSESVMPRNSGSSDRTFTYVLTCTNGETPVSASATVTVRAPLTMSLWASSTTIERGSSTTLSWTSTGTRSCAASSGWTGSMATSGSQAITPSPEGSYSYSMSCTGPSGTLSRTVTVTVVAPRPRVSISASPTTINDGDESFLSWSATNATSCSASGAWSGSRSLTGSEGVSPENKGSAPRTYTYTITCSGSGGSASASVTVTVNPASGAATCSSSSTSCVCWADQDGSGSIDQPSEQAVCDKYGSQSLCPLQQTACYRACGTCPWTCPYDGKPCTVDTGGGNYRCSKNPCMDQGSGTKKEVYETTPENDGPRDANGNCMGFIRIFPGAAKRCRKSGTQTAWQNCCTNNMQPLDDTTGKKGDKPQREYKEEKSSFEFWANQCDTKDQETALLADSNYCIYLGEYCAEKWPLVGCVQRAKSYCCFNSLLAKLIQEQGRPQLPAMGGFGSPTNPRCRGFSPEEFQALDFSKMDLSGYYSELEHKAQSTMQQEARDAANEKVGP